MKRGDNKAEADRDERPHKAWAGQSQGQVSCRWAAQVVLPAASASVPVMSEGHLARATAAIPGQRGAGSHQEQEGSTTHRKAGQGQRPAAAEAVREGDRAGGQGRHTESQKQNSWGWKGRQEILHSNPLPRQSHPQQVTQRGVRVALE